MGWSEAYLKEQDFVESVLRRVKDAPSLDDLIYSSVEVQLGAYRVVPKHYGNEQTRFFVRCDLDDPEIKKQILIDKGEYKMPTEQIAPTEPTKEPANGEIRPQHLKPLIKRMVGLHDLLDSFEKMISFYDYEFEPNDIEQYSLNTLADLIKDIRDEN